MNESAATPTVENVSEELNEAVNNILNLIAQIKIENYDSFDKINENEIEEFSKNIKIVEKCEKGGYKKLQEALNLNESYTPSFKNMELTKKQNILNNNLKFRDLYGKYMLKCEFDINFFSLLYLHEKDSLIYNLFRESGLNDIIKNGSRNKENDGYVYTDELKTSKASLIADACRILLGDILYIFQKWADDDAYRNNQLIDAEHANVDIFDKVEISGQEETFISEYKAVSLLLMGFNNLQNNEIDYYFLWRLFYRTGYNNNYMLQIFNKINSVFEKCSLENEIYYYDDINSLFFVQEVYSLFFVFKEKWEKVCYKMKVSNLSRLLNLFLEKFNCEENVKQNIFSLIEKLNSDQFIKQNDFDLASMRSYENYVNYVIEASNFEYAEENKTFFSENIFRSRFFKKAIEDEEFLNFILEKDENFEALLKCYNENSRLFYNRDITWETKVKVTLIKEGKVFRDDTAIGEVNRTSVIERMDKKPKLEKKEIAVLFELSYMVHWWCWWYRSLFLELTKDALAYLASVGSKAFLVWFFSNVRELTIETENGRELVPDILEKIQETGFFVLSENQQKVFDLVPEGNRKEFKDNFTQHSEFRAIVELLGQTITDTESFVKLYGGFIWTLNLVAVQLSFAMQLTFLNAMKGFVKGLEENQSKDLQKVKDTIKNESPRIPQMVNEASEIQV